MKKPTVRINPVAQQFAAPGERIIEVTFPDGQGALISLRPDRHHDGCWIIAPYELDVRIGVEGPRYRPSEPEQPAPDGGNLP